MTIGNSNKETASSTMSMDEIVRKVADYIDENYEEGDFFKSKYIEVEGDIDNKMIGKAIPDAIEELDHMEIELWSEGNGNLWAVTKDGE